jgi:hypothetical protein
MAIQIQKNARYKDFGGVNNGDILGEMKVLKCS